jgi:hypothetical protein
MLELIERRPPRRSDTVLPQAGVTPRVVGLGKVTAKPDFTPGARV